MARNNPRCVPGFELIGDQPPSLPSKPVWQQSLLSNYELISDLARYAEGLFTRGQVKKRWRKLITESMWTTLHDDDALVDAIEAEQTRRIRSGQAKIEKSQLLILKGPEILDSIATNPKSNDKHKIDAIRTLNGLTGNPVENEQRDRIVIRIDLSADTKDPKDIHVIEATPRPNVTPQEEPPPPRRAITDYSDE